MAIYFDESIHPETGELSYRVLNPNGVADVTFTTAGARLTYIDATGRLQTININGDYPQRPEPTQNAAQNIQNNIMADMIEGNGRQFVVGTIRGSAHQVAAAGGLLNNSRSRYIPCAPRGKPSADRSDTGAGGCAGRNARSWGRHQSAQWN